MGKFVEFFGPGWLADVAGRSSHDRQHGARVWGDDGLLPGRRRETLEYLRCDRPRTAEEVELVERYTKEQGLFRDRRHAGAEVHRTSGAGPEHESSRSLAGPKRPQDRVPLSRMQMPRSQRRRCGAPLGERGLWPETSPTGRQGRCGQRPERPESATARS